MPNFSEYFQTSSCKSLLMRLSPAPILRALFSTSSGFSSSFCSPELKTHFFNRGTKLKQLLKIQLKLQQYHVIPSAILKSRFFQVILTSTLIIQFYVLLTLNLYSYAEWEPLFLYCPSNCRVNQSWFLPFPCRHTNICTLPKGVFPLISPPIHIKFPCEPRPKITFSPKVTAFMKQTNKFSTVRVVATPLCSQL